MMLMLAPKSAKALLKSNLLIEQGRIKLSGSVSFGGCWLRRRDEHLAYLDDISESYFWSKICPSPSLGGRLELYPRVGLSNLFTRAARPITATIASNISTCRFVMPFLRMTAMNIFKLLRGLGWWAIPLDKGLLRRSQVLIVPGVSLSTHLFAAPEGLHGLSFAQRMGIARDAEINPFKDVLVFRRMVKYLRAIPINLKRNMWKSKDLIKTSINWDKPPKNGDGAWHAKNRLIDPDGEEFTKTLQSVPTSRKLFEREDPREIIDLDHFYDT
ncbi:hypothetical protein Tco_1160285 [Tanacetum coccineum]